LAPEGVVLETIQERWLRWDKCLNNEQPEIVVEEFDKMLKNKNIIVVGDLVRRDHALEMMGVVSMSQNAIEMRKAASEGGKNGRK